MTDEQMRDLVKECGLDWQRGYMSLFDGDPTNRYAVLIEVVEVAERERCAKLCDARAAAHLRDYTDAASPLYQSAEADHAADEAAACADAIRAKAAT
jgi:hypothetical protein